MTPPGRRVLDQPNPPDKTEPGQSNPLLQEALALEQQLSQASERFSREVQAQGWVGNFVDGLKSNVGGCAEGLPAVHPGAIWSNVVSHDSSSVATLKALEDTAQLLSSLKVAARDRNQDAFNKLYPQLTNRQFDGRPGHLAVTQRVDQYRESQNNMVDFCADGASLAASLATHKFFKSGNLGKDLLLASGVGGYSKAVVKDTDGAYSNLPFDLATGSLSGLSVPAGELISRNFLSRIGADSSMRRYLVAGVMDNAAQGGSFGFVDAGMREAASQYRQGKPLDMDAVLQASGQGFLYGTAGGGVLGFAGHGLFERLRKTSFDQPQHPVAPPPHLTDPPHKSDSVAKGIDHPQLKIEVDKLMQQEFTKAFPSAEVGARQLPWEQIKTLAKQGDGETLAKMIYAKFKSATLSVDQLRKVVDEFDGKERELATALLDASAPNASSVGLRNQLTGLKQNLSDLERDHGTAAFYTVGNSTPGNYVSYFLRKSLGLQREIHGVNHLKDLLAKGEVPEHIVLLDDFKSSSLTKEQLDLLKQVPNVTIVQMPPFEKGVNFFDMARGQDAVGQKLKELVGQAQRMANSKPGATADEIANLVLSSGAHELKEHLPNARVISPNTPVVGPSQSIDELHARLTPSKTTVEEIQKYLEESVGNEEQRRLLGRFLLDGAEYMGFSGIEKRSKDLYGRLVREAAAKGLKPEDLLFVTDLDPGGSTHMVSYSMKHAAGIPGSQFVTVDELKRLAASGEAKKKAVVVLDDTTYTGSSIQAWLRQEDAAGVTRSQLFGSFGHTFTASYGIFAKAQTNLAPSDLAQSGKLSMVFNEKFKPLHEGTFYQGLTSGEQQSFDELLTKFMGFGQALGFGGTESTVVWSHMVPDNSPAILRRFAEDILHLPGP